MSIETGKTETGRRVRQRREAIGLTQAELAVRAKTTVTSISRIEIGDTENPRTSSLGRIATALSTTLDYLTGATDDPGVLPSPSEFTLTAPENTTRVEYDSTAAPGAVISTYGAQPWYPAMEKIARSMPPRRPAWCWRDVRETHPARSSKVAVTPAQLAQLAQYYLENFPPPPDADDLEEAERRG